MGTWMETTTGESSLATILRTRPDLYEPLTEFVGTVWSDGMVEPVVLELCRLRIAQLHRCESELVLRYDTAADGGLTEEKVAALADYASSPLFTAHERACVAFAEQFTIDAHGITDELFAEVAAGFSSPKETTAFVSALALCDGLDRLRLILGVTPDFSNPTVVRHPAPGHLY